jgi:hypothetical protein
MAGFESDAPPLPALEMAGFDRIRKYRPTVSRSILSSRPMRRWDHRRSLKL